MGIKLSDFSFPKVRTVSPNELLRKNRLNEDFKRSSQFVGLVTYGTMGAIQEEGGYGWAISNLIRFPYIYVERPNFSFGNDGNYTGNPHSLSGDELSGFISLPTANPHGADNNYGKDLPSATAAVTSSTWSPAVFIPRVVHWWMIDGYFHGCHILVIQVNPDCTEVNKKVFLNYRFEGKGMLNRGQGEE